MVFKVNLETRAHHASRDDIRLMRALACFKEDETTRMRHNVFEVARSISMDVVFGDGIEIVSRGCVFGDGYCGCR